MKAGLNLKVMQFTFDWLGHTTRKIKYMLKLLGGLRIPRSLNKTSRNQCTLSITNSLLELINFLNKIREKDVHHGGSRHHHTGVWRMSPTVWAIGSSGTAAGWVNQPFETVLSYLRRLGFCDFFIFFFSKLPAVYGSSW